MKLNKCFVAVMVSCISGVTYADNSATSYAFEVDPATYALKGYSLHFRTSVPNSPNYRLGVGIYSLEFPKIFVDINPDNKDGDWDVELEQGIGFFGEYFLDSKRTGWFAGVQLAQQKYDVKDNLSEQEASFKTLIVMPYGGYKWDLNEHIYVTGWGGVGYVDRIDGSNHLIAGEYDIASLVPYGAIHVGYQY